MASLSTLSNICSEVPLKLNAKEQLSPFTASAGKQSQQEYSREKNHDPKKFKLPVSYIRKITLQVKSNTPLLDPTCPFTPKY